MILKECVSRVPAVQNGGKKGKKKLKDRGMNN